ncbi:MAG: helix-turn-helix transcriptional regulator [Clostridia bacterium]|nr:helix-turn-helix transcriptional regulator [Clostridia bacterium]
MYINNLRKIRKSKKLTIQELSELSGVSMGYICHLEKGSRQNPSRDVMEKISKVLEEPIAKIFF